MKEELNKSTSAVQIWILLPVTEIKLARDSVKDSTISTTKHMEKHIFILALKNVILHLPEQVGS